MNEELTTLAELIATQQARIADLEVKLRQARQQRDDEKASRQLISDELLKEQNLIEETPDE